MDASALKNAPALTVADFCHAYRLCRETAYKQIREGKLRAVKVGRRTLILDEDARAWASSLPDIRTTGSEQGPKLAPVGGDRA